MSKFRNKFIDTVRLYVRGGAGGMGHPQFKGIGGRGGSVYVEAAKGATLERLLYKYSKNIVTAEAGRSSKKFCVFGNPGEDKILPVPVGVTVYDEFMRKLGELNNLGDKLLVAEGGPGGSKDSRPPYSGSKGFSQLITIDLKVIADVGLVGFPNAGKSTLLKALSRAKPEIAAYSFTTLKPNLGIIQYPDLRQLKVADLPGLIEGASRNVGLGHKFLKHVERSNLLLMVVDINGFQYTPADKWRNCMETVYILIKEIELYNSDLLKKPAVLAINKVDIPEILSDFEEVLPILNNLPENAHRVPEDIRPTKFLKFDSIVPISAKHDKDSVEKLKVILKDSVDKNFLLSMKDVMKEQELELWKKIKRESTEVAKVVV